MTKYVRTRKPPQLGAEVADVRAWEDELARIEQQSRRSSAGMLALLGISRKRTGG